MRSSIPLGDLPDIPQTLDPAAGLKHYFSGKDLT